MSAAIFTTAEHNAERDRKRYGARIAELEAALGAFASGVERLAFEMPPPNAWTPQFVQLAQAAKFVVFRKSEQK